MIGALIIVFREVLEAGLIVGITLAVTSGVPGRTMWIGGGVVAGIVGAGLLAMSVQTLADALDGMGQDVFNFCVLATATVMLVWHNAWMSTHGREMAQKLRQAGQDVESHRASLLGLAVVVALAVLREGSEVVLFLYGLVAAGGETWAGILLGGLLGLAAGAAAGALTYFGLVTLPTKLLFRVTTALIALLASGMAAQAVGFLEQSGLIPASPLLWDTSAILSDRSMLGRPLHVLIGYIDQPSAWQAAAYGAALALNLLLTVPAFRRSPRKRTVAA